VVADGERSEGDLTEKTRRTMHGLGVAWQVCYGHGDGMIDELCTTRLLRDTIQNTIQLLCHI
jgi:hypothetical protein